MAFGLKCFSPGQYVTFDSTSQTRYFKVTVSGEVTLSGGSTSSTIAATDLRYVLVFFVNTSFSGLGAKAEQYTILNQTTTGFRIRNDTTQSKTFFYVGFTS